MIYHDRNLSVIFFSQKHGVRLKCSACRIIVHSECLGNLPEAAKCKSSFKDDGVRQYREHKTVKHHWMHRRTQKDKCSQCGKVSNTLESGSANPTDGGDTIDSPGSVFELKRITCKFSRVTFLHYPSEFTRGPFQLYPKGCTLYPTFRGQSRVF